MRPIFPCRPGARGLPPPAPSRVRHPLLNILLAAVLLLTAEPPSTFSERFAKGEMDKAEFEEKRKLLRR